MKHNSQIWQHPEKFMMPCKQSYLINTLHRKGEFFMKLEFLKKIVISGKYWTFLVH